MALYYYKIIMVKMINIQSVESHVVILINKVKYLLIILLDWVILTNLVALPTLLLF